jgi:hypothetical protein
LAFSVTRSKNDFNSSHLVGKRNFSLVSFPEGSILTANKQELPEEKPTVGVEESKE